MNDFHNFSLNYISKKKIAYLPTLKNIETFLETRYFFWGGGGLTLPFRKKIAVIILKSEHLSFTICPKIVDRMANSEDPETRPACPKT